MFSNTMRQYVAQLRDALNQQVLNALITPLFDKMSSRMISSAGLVIKAGGSTLAKTGASAAKYFANGIYGNIAAATDMPALVGTVANATFNVFCFFIDSAGTATVAMGTAGATRAAMKFPPFPQGKALVGTIEINPTGTGDFVGGTTALDDATVVPTAFFISAVSGYDPACIIGGS